MTDDRRTHRLVKLSAGLTVVAQSSYQRRLLTYWTTWPTAACARCGTFWEHQDLVPLEEMDSPQSACTPRCVHCGYLELQHTAGCCLFAPTRFTSEEFTITSSPDGRRVIQDVILGKSQG